MSSARALTDAAMDHQDSATRFGECESTTSLATWLRGHLPAFPTALVVTLVLAALVNPIEPIAEERVSYGNPILLLRLATAGVAWALGLWGVVQIASPRRLLSSLPGLLLIGLSVVLLGSAVLANAPSRLISFASALIFAGYLLFLASSVATIGLYRTMSATCVGSIFYLLIAWFVFLALPGVGRFYEYTDATSTVIRMGGVAHPNSIAREAAVSLVVFLGLVRYRGAQDTGSPTGSLTTRFSLKRWAILAIVVLIVATLATTISRTSMLAGAAGASMVFFDKLYGRRGLLIGLAGACLLLAAFLLVTARSHQPLDVSATSLLTKSGNVEELTSLTGRTLIWAEALELIRQQPLTGYGLDSAASVMTKESVGTHSLILHVLFSGGIFAGLLMSVLLLLTVGLAFNSKEPLFRGLATYILVSGLVEDTLFTAFPCQLTLAFVAIMLASRVVEPRWQPSRRPELSGHGVS